LKLAPLAGGVALALACRPAPARLSAEHARAIVDSVRATFADYAGRLNARDIDSVARFYSADSGFVWLEDGQVRYRSRDSIRVALAGLLAFRNVRISIDSPAVTALGPGAAAISATFDQALVDSAGGGAGFVGAMTIAARHTPAGWKWIAGHTSVRREPRRPS
jgi:ketosteroid isomerase-like protein